MPRWGEVVPTPCPAGCGLVRALQSSTETALPLATARHAAACLREQGYKLPPDALLQARPEHDEREFGCIFRTMMPFFFFQSHRFASARRHRLQPARSGAPAAFTLGTATCWAPQRQRGPTRARRLERLPLRATPPATPDLPPIGRWRAARRPTAASAEPKR